MTIFKLLSRTLGRIRGAKTLLVSSLLFSFLAMLLFACGAFLTQYLVDHVIPSVEFRLLIGFCAFLALYELSHAASTAYSELLSAYVDKYVDCSMLDDYFSRLLYSPFSVMSSRRSGDLLQRVNDAQQVKVFITTVLGNWLLHAVLIVFCLLILAILDATVAGLVLCGMVALALTYLIFSPKVIRLESIRFEAKSELLSMVNFSIKSSESIRCHDQANHIYGMKLKSLSEYVSKEEKIKKYNISARLITNAIRVATSVTVRFVVIFAAFTKSGLSIGQMLTIFLFAEKVFSSLIQIMMSSLEVRRSGVVVERYLGFLDATEKPDSGQRAAPRNGSDPITRVELARYKTANSGKGNSGPPDEVISLRPGDVVRISGPNGCGKTTFCRSVARLIESDGVKASFFEKKRWIPADELRSRVSMTGINDSVFPGTILENITMGRECDIDQLIDLSHKIGLQSLIQSRVDGFDHQLSVEHPALSEGEMRKLFFMRVLFSGADVLIFDEAFRGVDQKSMDSMENALMSAQDKIIFIVTHQDHRSLRYTHVISLGDSSSSCAS